MLPRRARAKERLRSLLEVQWLAIEPDDRVLLYVDRTVLNEYTRPLAQRSETRTASVKRYGCSRAAKWSPQLAHSMLG